MMERAFTWMEPIFTTGDKYDPEDKVLYDNHYFEILDLSKDFDGET